jgi:RNA polymerase sigma-70 factor, ECF subfamily
MTADTAELRPLGSLSPLNPVAGMFRRRENAPAAAPETSAAGARRGRRAGADVAGNLSHDAPLGTAEEDSQGMAATVATAITAPNATIEAALITRAQAGDHAAFETIFTQYQTAIYNYIYRLMGSAEDAYDMTQDTFLKAFLALPRTSEDLRVGAWLYRIATNVCLDELRHRKLVKWQPWEAFISVFHPSQVAKDSPERDCLDREDNEEVQLILQKMHPKYRMCLVLREYHDLSYDEIAEVLNTTRAAVKSLLFRAREEFRQVYGKVERQPGRAKG